MDAKKKNPAKPGRTPFACDPTYGPLVPAAKAFGVSRSVAFDLARRGLIRTFTLGARRYVYLDRLRTLPERLAEGEV